MTAASAPRVRRRGVVADEPLLGGGRYDYADAFELRMQGGYPAFCRRGVVYMRVTYKNVDVEAWHKTRVHLQTTSGHKLYCKFYSSNKTYGSGARGSRLVRYHWSSRQNT